MMGTDDRPAEEVPAVVAEANLRSLDRQVEKDSYLSKHSHLFGWVDLYAPDADPKDWGKRPWVLEVERDAETKIAKSYKVKASHAREAFTHIGLLAYKEEWLYTPDKLIPSEET